VLASWVAARGARGILVFDGHGATERHGPLEVRWAAHADTLIERLAAENRGRRQVAVVSSDEAVRETAGVEVRKLSSKTFVDELTPPAHDAGAPGDLRDKLDAETLAKLERLRRGGQS
jgi:predicted RNA-binding protein with PIN domain